MIAAGNSAANPHLGRTAAPVFLNGLWAAGVVAALAASWRWPRVALGAAVVNIPAFDDPRREPVLLRAPIIDVGPVHAVGGVIPPGPTRWEPAWVVAEVALVLVAPLAFRRGRE
ncbi:MAG: hypothetical protein ACRDJU_05300 [Actinomycetota bacterium]